jgi:hypothetical protein
MIPSKEKYWQYQIPLFLILAIFSISGSIACKRPQRFQAYDGIWWINTPVGQRLGFIDGFVDCYTYGFREGEKLWKPRTWYQAAISAYYEKHSGDDSMRVGQVLIRVAESTDASSLAGGESLNIAKQNGAFDGLVWLNYSQKERIGFVEGYLNAMMPQMSRSVSFPKSPEYYADAITKRYSVSTIDQPRTNIPNDSVKQKIAEVLWGMRNRGQQK